MPYAFCEQIGKEIRDISDEIPFEIPDSWEWVRLGMIGETNIGLTYRPADKTISGGTLVLRSSNVQNDRMDYSDTVYVSCEIPERTMIHKGDILICARNGSRALVGKCAIVDKDGMAFGAFMAKYSSPFNQYIKLFIDSPSFRQQLDGVKTETINQITQDMLKNQLCPLPPVNEQIRIVEMFYRLLPYIERYGKAEEHLTTLNTTFPEALKKSILQEAVQGKLVPQNPDDEPASVLLERIRYEKQELIKQGKIKKNKNESVIITRDKIPYEIPDSWVWCKLSDLAILENGDRSSKYPVEADYVEIGIPFFGAKDIDGDMMSFQNVRFISQQKYDELGNGKLVDGDIICLLRGSVGKTAKFEANEQFDTGFICAQMLIIRLLDKSLFGYISSYFKSPDYTNYVESKVTGTAVRQMPAKEMGNLLIPLPPLAEQHRIVAKIEEIMPMIERLTLR